MPKKTARAANRTAQQKSKEEQWRKRMAAQTQTRVVSGVAPRTAGAASAVTDRDGVESPDSVAGQMMADGAQAEVPAGTVRAPGTARQRAAVGGGGATRTQATSAAVQRRAAMAAAARTSARSRLAQNTLSIDDEMRFIKGDIRRLIILTAICVAVIIALSFIVPSIIT